MTTTKSVEPDFAAEKVEFEAFADEQILRLEKLPGGFYVDPTTQFAWLSWARRASLESGESHPLIAENECREDQFKEWQTSHHRNYCLVADERDQLKAEVEELRKDAERYRWLRGDTSAGKVDFCIMRKHLREDALSEVLALAEADQQIDVAMSRESGHE
ncbi:hypothetical protein PMM47T1_14000 [Pseudomonas sp. M47T1]|uniref:hypothetical protein n=1 Tax=Pseudomonas sp. M47T1 TaxID=1179778 RepID=UPI000260882C|nr:hypothetical protein [Pseudomonas sp. M47T1]EIK96078.1 hypothetical protein PMM47T1_14000 [Pseudomonas sp. M47T1]